MTTNVIVSNGREFYEVPARDVEAARADGFYLPSERGLTIVSNGSEVYEISVVDVAQAQQDGFTDLLAERPGRQKPRRRPKAIRKPNRAVLTKTPVPDGGPPDEVVWETDIADVAGKSVENDVLTEAESVETSPVRIDTGEETVGLIDASDICIEPAEDEDEKRRCELEQELAESAGLRKVWVLVCLHSPSWRQQKTFAKTYGVSTALHLLVLIVLAFVILNPKPHADGGAVISSVISHDEPVEEAKELVEEVTLQEPSSDEIPSTADLAGKMMDNIGLDTTDFAANIDAATMVGGLDGLGKAIGEDLDKVTGKGVKTKAAFFGSKSVASRFVFVIDNSNSMTKGRFETALNELYKTVSKMTPKQSFYVIFYSDTAYPMFHPRPARALIPATPKNRQYLFRWLMTVPLCLRTKGEKAVQMAFALNPDVIYILGDGAFNDNTVKLLTDPGQNKISVHTLGMEVKSKDAEGFQAIAKKNGGTYHDVGVSPVARQLASQNPRPRNKTRGPVWGITLPE